MPTGKNGRFLVAITGTPGAGKSFFADQLARETKNLGVIEINSVVNRHKTFGGKDGFGAKIVNLGSLNKALRKEIVSSKKKSVLIVGHLAPELSFRYQVAVVLRCDLKTLAARMKRRGYPREKIAENLASEAFDYCGEKIRGKSAECYEVEKAVERAELRSYVLALVDGRRAKKPKSRRMDKFSELRAIIGSKNPYGL